MAGSKLKSNFTLTWALVGLLSAPALAAAADTNEDEFSMSIMDVFSITGRGTALTGQVASGSLVEKGTVLHSNCEPGEVSDKQQNQANGT